MTDLSRDELRAHLSAVEAQVRAALRIVASESKTMQQAHAALRADLSAALVRLQADVGSSTGRIDNKVDKLIADVTSMSAQRRLTTTILAAVVLSIGLAIGITVAGALYLVSDAARSGVTVPMDIGRR
ncbi:MAG: hypothetical protein AB7G39_01615 [Alphaproteobacteria bacterium]